MVKRLDLISSENGCILMMCAYLQKCSHLVHTNKRRNKARGIARLLQDVGSDGKKVLNGDLDLGQHGSTFFCCKKTEKDW